MSDLWTLFLSYMLPIFASILATLAAYALALLGKKIGVEVDLTKDAAIRVGIRKLIGAAEEWAARKAKVEEKPEGKDKARYVLDLAAKQWPKLLPDDLERILDEELASTKGVGATGESAVK